jgi:hypothetical protein
MTQFTPGFVAESLAIHSWFVGSLLTAVGAEVFTVDPNQSLVSISGSIAGTSLESQGSGSLTTQFGGSILADMSGTTIQFPGQSQVTGLNSGTWQPMPDGSDGSAPATFGAKASLLFTTGVAAVRNVQFDITSAALTLVNGQFDAQPITFSIAEGAACSAAYRTEGALSYSGAVALDGRSVTGQDAMASLSVVGSQQVLSIPIHYTLTFSLLDQDDTSVTLTGQLVAARNL